MTLLIGVRGKDGIALGADQKVMRGGEADYASKIQIVEGAAFATEGLTGMADDFFLLLRAEVARKKGFGNLYEAKTIAEDIISELTARYKNRLSESSLVGVLMAGLEDITSGPAKMYYIYSEGYGEAVDFRCTGSGAPYATALVKFLRKKDETAEENAKKIAYTIHWVSEDVSTEVGGDPQVAILHDGKADFVWLSAEEVKRQGDAAKSGKTNLWACLNNKT